MSEYLYFCTQCKVWLTQEEVDKRKFYHRDTPFCPECKEYGALVKVKAENINW